jgi:geranylgeranyl diphosphate synthase type II
MFDLKAYMAAHRKRIDRALDGYLPSEEARPRALHESMRYSVFSGGKRFRPILCLASFEACDGKGDGVLPVACAIELIHTYSLIHDDLPCMDDDDLRRGKPTNHKVFGEAVAVLAGDALLTSAVEVIAREAASSLGTRLALEILVNIMRAAGSEGMVAGQVVDMQYEGKEADAEAVEYIHSHKTAALIEACVRCGALAAGADEHVLERLSAYGRKLGLAFQVTDDILDAEGSFGRLKSAASLDEQREKATYVGVFGLEASREIASGLVAGAKDSIADMGGRTIPLLYMADLVLNRSFRGGAADVNA